MSDHRENWKQWLPYRADRNSQHGGRSFYIFDFDDNIIHLNTQTILFHKKDGSTIQVSPHELLEMEMEVEVQTDKYADYCITDNSGMYPGKDIEDSFYNFRDHYISPIAYLRGKRQNIIQEINEIVKRPAWEWHGPSWNHFSYAVLNRRPISIITARGHRPRTMTQALLYLCRSGQVLAKPNILAIYPVSYPTLRRKLGDSSGKKTVAELKRIALYRTVELAFKKYGHNPYHRFGVSDDDPRNIREMCQAFTEMKHRFPKNAFFVIDCSGGRVQKTEIFDDHVEPSNEIKMADALNYQLFDF